MTTIMEMAQKIRDQDIEATAAAQRILDKEFQSRQVDISDSDQVALLCRTLGTTRFQLCRVIDKVGHDISLITRQLQRR